MCTSQGRTCAIVSNTGYGTNLGLLYLQHPSAKPLLVGKDLQASVLSLPRETSEFTITKASKEFAPGPSRRSLTMLSQRSAVMQGCDFSVKERRRDETFRHFRVGDSFLSCFRVFAGNCIHAERPVETM